MKLIIYIKEDKQMKQYALKQHKQQIFFSLEMHLVLMKNIKIKYINITKIKDDVFIMFNIFKGKK